MKMKVSYAYGFIIILLVFSAVTIYREDSPEKLIVGRWEEVSWEFERVNVDSVKKNSNLEEFQKREIYQNLMIHNAEEWEFFPGRILTLKHSTDTPETELKWVMKGRGHILELKYGDDRVECYQIHELTKDTLVVYFNFDLQIRGMVKMTFKKVDEQSYAQKI
jgi:hypothetical protein